MAEKFGYNDALTSDNLRKLRIKLPIEYKEDGSRVYDSEKRYSDEGFVPDWGGMEKCMKELKKKVDKSLDSFQAVSDHIDRGIGNRKNKIGIRSV